jgi:hypothetical protein
MNRASYITNLIFKSTYKYSDSIKACFLKRLRDRICFKNKTNRTVLNYPISEPDAVDVYADVVSGHLCSSDARMIDIVISDVKRCNGLERISEI